MQAGTEVFDLYVVDINMPRMDGYSFVRELRKLGAQHQAPVLMVSTEAKSADANAASEAGANSYLVKPSRPHELVLSAALLVGDADAARKAAEQAAQLSVRQPSRQRVGAPS
jgi:two-component system chemotaxis response regulator CheY